MNSEQVNQIAVRSVLVPDSLAPQVAMGSAIQCLSVDEKGFRFRRMNLFYEGEEFFVSRQMIEQSHWMFAPNHMQLRFL